jgi:hypothetical protein
VRSLRVPARDDLAPEKAAAERLGFQSVIMYAQRSRPVLKKSVEDFGSAFESRRALDHRVASRRKTGEHSILGETPCD